jgi:predicted O-methyltransferase YrrM
MPDFDNLHGFGNVTTMLLVVYFSYLDCNAEQTHLEWDTHTAKGVPTSKAHSVTELLHVITTLINHHQEFNVQGVICEFGCYTGISSAKLSLLASLLKKQFLVFDSFEGLPNVEEYGSEAQQDIYESGQYSSTLATVRNNITKFGVPKVTSLVKGWFSETLPNFNAIETIAYAFVDVDLCKSCEECFDFILPRLQTNGVLFCHEADDPDYMPIFEKYGLLDTTKYESVGAGTGLQTMFGDVTHLCMFIKKD